VRELQATNTGSAPGGLRADPAHLSAGQIVGRATARPGLPARPAAQRAPAVAPKVAAAAPAPAPAPAAAAAAAVRPGASLEEELAAVKAAGGFSSASPAADDLGSGRVKQGEYTYKVYPAVRPLGATFATRAYRGVPARPAGPASPAGGRRVVVGKVGGR
jgi:2-oxoglutarate dehydrogenase E2 component (dihydrolipoamide succinyltransferase)